MDFKVAHEFIIGDIAPNYVFGCTWCLYSAQEYEKKKEMLKQVKEEIGENSVAIIKVKNGAIVFVTHKAYSDVMGSLEGSINVINVKEDRELHQKNAMETVDAFMKFLLKNKNNKPQIIGLYCTNKVSLVKEKYKESHIEYPAFRLTLPQAIEIAKSKNITLTANVNESQISNGLTALMIPVIIK